MRKIFLTLFLVFFLAVPVFAEVTAEIIKTDLDENGNIRVWAQYKIDGVEVKSDYPKINDKFVYCTRYAAHNFAGMSDSEIEEAILYQSKIHAETLTRQEFIKKTISTNNEIFDEHLKSLAGKTVIVKEAEIRINDTKVMKVRSDGTKTTSNISR